MMRLTAMVLAGALSLTLDISPSCRGLRLKAVVLAGALFLTPISLPRAGACVSRQWCSQEPCSSPWIPPSPCRGLRLKAVVLAGALILTLDPASGHLILGKRTQAAVTKLLSKAPLGQVAMHWSGGRGAI